MADSRPDDGSMQDLIAAVEPLIPGLRRYATALVRDTSAADDLVQDCLERLVAGWRRRRDDGVSAWAFTILRNLALNHLRQLRGRGPKVPIEEADASSSLSVAPAEGGLGCSDILRVLDRLPEEQKSVLLLVAVEDRSYAEVARILGVPIGTVMSRLSRGRERLRRLMQDDGGAARTGSIRRIK
jgi:RNA polymerase sigma factor (sigma-70 family)